MKELLLERKAKLQRDYRKEANISTYSRLKEINLLLAKLSEHDARTSVKDTGSAEGGDSPQLQHYQPSVSPDGRYI